MNNEIFERDLHNNDYTHSVQNRNYSRKTKRLSLDESVKTGYQKIRGVNIRSVDNNNNNNNYNLKPFL